MIALRFLSREEWEDQLRYYRCRPMVGTMPLNTAEWWVSEWKFIFTVPVEDDGTCHQTAFQKLISDIMASAPRGTTFP